MQLDCVAQNHKADLDLHYNHLGFDADRLNPLNGCDGCDFLENAGQGCIDFASIHLYPQNYLRDNAKVLLRGVGLCVPFA